MPILLCRVDDRLIHGQVVVGWGARLGLDYIVVVDDNLSESDWEQDLFRAGLPAKVQAGFVSVAGAEERFPEWQAGRERVFVLTRDLETMRRLAENGVLEGIEINLGGLHLSPDRQRVLPYLFLSDQDREELERLGRTGVPVSAQDVPTARKIGLDEII